MLMKSLLKQVQIVPIQSDFTEKCIMWYLYNKAKDWREYDELWIKYFR